MGPAERSHAAVVMCESRRMGRAASNGATGGGRRQVPTETGHAPGPMDDTMDDTGHAPGPVRLPALTVARTSIALRVLLQMSWWSEPIRHELPYAAHHSS